MASLIPPSASQHLGTTRRQLLKTGGMLLVGTVVLPPLRAQAPAAAASAPASAPAAAGAPGAYPVPSDKRVDSFIAIGADGAVVAYNGHVDLGTGVRTALGQLVADELDVAFDRLSVVLGHTNRTPDQGPTIASNTIQVAAVPMRQAAAQLRQWLLARAAQQLSVPLERLTTSQGYVLVDGGASRHAYGELVQGQDLQLPIDEQVVLRPVADRKYIGQPVPRVDIPAKLLGALTYVHDLRVPGMLHARVVRPPYTGADAPAPLGASLVSVDEASVKQVPGLVKVVVQGDFVAVVAEREEQAIAAMRQLKVKWKDWAGLPDLSLAGLGKTLLAHPKKARELRADSGWEAAQKSLKTTVQRDYVWPYHAHGSIGPSCAVAEMRDGKLVVWSGSQNPHDVRKDIAKLLGMPADDVLVIRMEAAGCYGRNCADDVSADAALLAKAVGKPVRVQLMREQEAGWEPKGTGQLIQVKGGLDAQGGVAAYDFSTCYPSNNAATLALVLTGKVPAATPAQEMGDRTAIPQYEYPHMHVVAQDAVPIARASWLRGVSALPNVFAHESWIDECAHLAAQDPIAYRLRYLKDPRAIALIEAVKQRCGWAEGPSHRQPAPAGQRLLKGRGFAYARYFHSKFPGYGAAWCVWVCDLTVDRQTGEVKIDKLWVGHDCGAMVNPAGVRHQVHGNVVQSCSRVLKEYVTFDARGVTSLDWGTYPILRFEEVPPIDVLLLDMPGEPPKGAGESASVPSAAAVGNALFDATGVRLLEVPFTPARILAALKTGAAAPAQRPASEVKPS